MAYADGRKIAGPTGVRWVASSTGMLHSVQTSDGMYAVKSGGKVEWKVASVKAECGQTFGPKADGSKRCKSCVKIVDAHTERKAKSNAHLTERRPEPVQTGLRGGDTAEAERKRKKEAETLRKIAERDAKIANGEKVKGRGPKAPGQRVGRIDGEVRVIAPAPVLVPTASVTPTGPGRQAMSDGPGLTKGAPIVGSASPRMWRNPATGELEQSGRGYMADSVPPQPSADKTVVGPRDGREIVSNRGINGGSRRTNKRNARRARQRQTMRALAIGKGK